MNDRVLDIGPGVAPWLEATDAVDIEDQRADWAETSGNEGARLARSIQFVVGNAEDLPYPDSTFTFVNANQVFGRYAGLRAGLSEAVRVLKPKGTLRIRVLGEDRKEAISLLRHLGMRVGRPERQGYDEDISKDDFDILARKS